MNTIATNTNFLERVENRYISKHWGDIMDQKENQRASIKDGLISGFPIVIGYFPIAMTFGILSKTMSISFLESILFSAIVYAGASQFMALNLLNMGIGITQIVATIFLVNFRHFLMSASIATKMEKSKWTPFIAFGITDESFSVASFKEDGFDDKFMVALQFISYISWITGTMSGYLIGEIIPVAMRSSMEIGIYAMFVALLIPKTKQSNKVLIIALLSGVTNTLLIYSKILPEGWNLIVAIISVSVLGAVLYTEEELENHGR